MAGKPGTVNNPKGKGGFGERPEDRHSGAWRKEDTARYKLEQMTKMNDDELEKIYVDKEAPLFERKLARAIKEGEWKEIREIIHEVYGTPKQTVISEGKVDPVTLLLKKYGVNDDGKADEAVSETSGSKA